LNIVRNALKYTDGGGRVTIGAETDEGAREIRIRVEDSGIGISAKDLPHIFERFYRADKSRSRGEGGSGLGLSIAKWIAEAHGGRISAESAEGKGSVFTIHLPTAPPQTGQKNSQLYYYS
jgi:signal transduction histidine kinase